MHPRIIAALAFLAAVDRAIAFIEAEQAKIETLNDEHVIDAHREDVLAQTREVIFALRLWAQDQRAALDAIRPVPPAVIVGRGADFYGAVKAQHGTGLAEELRRRDDAEA